MKNTKDRLDLDDHTIEELIVMNQLICQEITRRHNQAVRKELSGFDISDRVFFDHPDGHRCYGTVLRVNQKTVTVRADDKRMWRIAAGLVKKDKAMPHKKHANLISLSQQRS